jgi:hypothetical protein
VPAASGQAGGVPFTVFLCPTFQHGCPADLQASWGPGCPPTPHKPCVSWIICLPTSDCPRSWDCPPSPPFPCPPTPHAPCQWTPVWPCITQQCTAAVCPSNPVGCVTIGGCPLQPNAGPAGGAEAVAAPAARAMGTLFHCPSPPIICNAPAHTPVLPCITQGCTSGPLCPKTPVLPCVTQQCTVMPQCVTAPPANCQHTPVMPCFPTPHFACPSIHPGCPTFHMHGGFVC